MALSDLLPWNWGSGGNITGAQNYTDIASAMNPALAGQASIANTVPADASSAAASINPSWTAPTSGGMNWAGLSTGLSNLSKNLTGTGQAAGSNTLQTSPSVSSTVSSGALAPKDAGGGASALASMLNNREQLAQYVLLSALQGKGRSSGGKGLLG